MLQEELANVIVAAGLAFNKADNTQLRQAITALVTAGGIQTGVTVFTLATSAPAGWIMANDGSIGNAASNATTRANADCLALYTVLWNGISNTWAPTQTAAGAAVARGASAVNDWNANRRILIPRFLGRKLAAAGSGLGLATHDLGEWRGEEQHTLATSEYDHTNSIPKFNGAQGPAGGILIPSGDTGGIILNASLPHNVLDPTLYLNAIIKL